MNDYARQNWRQPDADIERENEFAGILVAAFVGAMIGAVFIGWFVA